MITGFILMTGAWYDSTEAAMEAAGPSAAFYFVFVMVVNCYLILNLFVAILLEAFASGEEEEAAGDGTSAGAAEGGGGTLQKAGEAGVGGGGAASKGEAEGGEDEEEMPAHHDRALCCLAPTNPLRRCACAIVFNDAFEGLVISVIVASSVCLAIDAPRLDPFSDVAHYIRQLDLVWTIFFSMEAALKIVALGFLCNGR